MDIYRQSYGPKYCRLFLLACKCVCLALGSVGRSVIVSQKWNKGDMHSGQI